MELPADPKLCIKCKGKGLCGRPSCPIYEKAETMFQTKSKLKSKDFFGSSPPSIFVGRYGYPEVNVGVLSPPFTPDNAWEYDAPEHWAKEGYKIKKIVDLRSSLINSRDKRKVKAVQGKGYGFLDLIEQLASSRDSVDLEVKLKKKPSFKLSFEPNSLPMGPASDIEKVEATENISTSKKIYRVIDDPYFKSQDAIWYLYKKGFPPSFISNMLSSGSLGLADNRKLVPTRWSITAVDSTIGKRLRRRVRDYKKVNDFKVFHGRMYGNRFVILAFPEIWGYELYEIYEPGSVWHPGENLQYTHDTEGREGRSSYAGHGGYYAARLAILEKLDELKREARTICFRIISDDYWAPLGVWVVREAVRKAMNNKKEFETMERALNYIRSILPVSIDKFLAESDHYQKYIKQRKLSEFF